MCTGPVPDFSPRGLYDQGTMGFDIVLMSSPTLLLFTGFALDRAIRIASGVD